MNRKMIFSTLRIMLMVEGGLMLLPLIVALIYGESNWWIFAVLSGGLMLFGGLFNMKTRSGAIYTKDGFIICGLCWVLFSMAGALPFVIDGCIPNFIDAFFEVVSGFTTTGASIIPASQGVESLSHGMLFWRSFTHWVGGMGVLVLVSAIVPLAAGRSMFILKAEMPGPAADKLVPKAKETARILYLIYIALSLLQVVIMCCGGMPIFDSLCIMFGTAGTGGFVVTNAGISGYSLFNQIVITVFMALFSINFNVYFLIISRKFRAVLKNEEMWLFLGIFAVSTAIIAWNVISFGVYTSSGEAIKDAAFQVSTIMSTTGFATANFSNWPQLSQTILLILMFIGACAGSTGGGIKVVRLLLTGKIIGRDLKKVARPNDVTKIRMNGNVVSEEMISGVKTYFIIYVAAFFISFVLLAFEGKDIVTTFSSVAACYNNIGPGLGNIVGPAGDYSSWSAIGKIILSFDMLLGRLELYPMLMLLMPAIWRRKAL